MIRRASTTIAIVVSVISMNAQQAPAGRGVPAGPPPTIEQRTAGMQKLDGYFPLYWDERDRQRCSSRFRASTRSSSTRPGSRPGSGSNDIGLDRGSRVRGSIVTLSARRSARAAWCSRTNRSARRAPTPRSASRWRTRSRSRSCGASPWRRRATATCWWTRRDFVLRDGHGAADALRPGTYRVDRTRSAVYHAAHEGVSEEHRDRSDADVRE